MTRFTVSMAVLAAALSACAQPAEIDPVTASSAAPVTVTAGPNPSDLTFEKRVELLTNLFNADSIVENFSNMDGVFLSNPLSVDTATPWPVEVTSLPDTVTIAGKVRPTRDVLDELDTTSLVIIRDGILIHEEYNDGTQADDLRISWSVAKSFMSGLYGNVLANGQIGSLDDLVTQYVPELVGTAYDGATIRNVLNMASGIRFDENYADPDSDINKMGQVVALGGSLDDYTASLTESAREPGTQFQYVSMDTHVGAWVLRRATGKTLHELFEETYGPMGFERAPYYLVDGQNVAFALGGLNLTTRDYARFGQLFLQEGEWEGEQIIPADWVRESTRPSAPGEIPGRPTGYAYQWWIPTPFDGDYMAAGIYGQYVYVDPDTGIVIAKTAADREFMGANADGIYSFQVNADLFRSLAEQLAEKPTE